MDDTNKTEWLLLIHQIPPKPDYFRVKIWRRLQKIGAVAIKQSVYVLPDQGQAYEDLSWVVKEISENGGTASLAKSVFLEGLSDAQIESFFHVARNGDYGKIVEDSNAFIGDSVESFTVDTSSVSKKRRELSRLKNRFAEVLNIDFFNAPGRDAAERILGKCDALLNVTQKDSAPNVQPLKIKTKQTWVTRKGIYVDRIASAWLILRFIDPKGCVKFVADDKYNPAKGELRFDMFEGEFTHIGDNCTFEVLMDTFGLTSPAMSIMAEIIHDIDLKDDKYSRPEVMGVQAVFSGMVATSSDDNDRLQRGFTILDELYASFGGTVKNQPEE